MAWRWDDPCPHDAVVKNVATTTSSPTSRLKTIPQAIRDLDLREQPCLSTYPSSLPSLFRSMSLPAAHYPPVQTQGRILHLSLRAVRAPLHDRQHGGGGFPSLGNLGRDGSRIVKNQIRSPV